MENIRNIFLEQIEQHTDTFNNLSTCLINSTILSNALLALQEIIPSSTRTLTRQFLSHYIVYYFPKEVIGEIGGERLIKASQNLYNVHIKDKEKHKENEITNFENVLNEYVSSFSEWQKFDKEKLAGTYRDAYRLLSEMKVSSPIEIQEPAEKLERTLDKHTKQIFGVDAQKILNNQNNEIQKDTLDKMEKFVYESIHEIYWQNMIKQLEENSFDSLCTVIEDVKVCMIALSGKNQLKRDEVESSLDVAFLKNVLHVGMAQNQVKCLLKYCLRFLREYGQPCHDTEIDELNKTTDSLYTQEVKNTIELLTNIIREIATRINNLVTVVYQFLSDK
jgi:hypothetical protein